MNQTEVKLGRHKTSVTYTELGIHQSGAFSFVFRKLGKSDYYLQATNGQEASYFVMFIKTLRLSKSSYLQSQLQIV